jgi:sugar lactone lactonase YvrE
MFATFGAVTAHAQTSIALPGERVFPESIAASRDGTLYVGSVGQGGVFRIEPHSKEAHVWIQPGAFGTHSLFGVLADDKSNTLWVCSNDLTSRGVIIGASDGISALKGFDLKSGAGKISAALPTKPATCNDITIGPDGSAFVSNSAAPQILRLAPGGKEFDIWFTDPSLQPATGAGLDGLAFGPDGNLYVDRFTPGDLYRINVKNGKATGATRLTTSRPLELADAIRRYRKDQFLLVEGGGRLDSFTVQGDNVAVEILKDGYTTRPTGVAVVGKTAWVSEGQLSYLFDPALKGQKPSLPFQISSVPLPTAH